MRANLSENEMYNCLVKKELSKKIFSLLIAGLIGSVATSASAWTGPTASPPSGNVAAPLNVSTADQLKHGWIGLDSMSILNHLIISGAANTPNTVRYLNFGATWDAAGYGIRDNAGTLEFKNSGGTWASIQSTVNTLVGNGGQWTTSGSNIYYNTGNVGVGTASPTYALTVTSGNKAISVGEGTGSDADGRLVMGWTSASGATPAWANISAYQGGYRKLQIEASPLVLNSNGSNVGIGTMNPAGRLESDSNGAGVWAGMFNYGAGAPSGAYGIWTYGTSYALYAQGPVVTTGNVSVGSAVLGTNGDLYMPWKGQWLSTVLSNLPGRLGGQFWVAAYAWNGISDPNWTGRQGYLDMCPSGSIVVGTYQENTQIPVSDPNDGYTRGHAAVDAQYNQVLCQWITQ
ncbi:MAG: hypothetical protein JWM46_636 [Candidatus Kaiserbacteria bacterium]|nr:hypothetical protein [Candidatus Kaiserbacteria bacterium]